ncbi:MAG: metallophosphoesterase [Planctomycetes bacterium]|nr:metallophosphoesterase [Planctomycetota bacterium]
MNNNQPSHNVSRREVIRIAGAAALGFAGTRSVLAQNANPSRKRVLRIAHLTDIHIAPERRAAEGFTACLKHVQSQKDKPDLIFTGGDHIMDSIGANEARTREQWGLYKKVLKAECSLPVESCIGNHDCWGLNRKDSGATGNEPLYGKKWAMDSLGLDREYRSFDRAGWHFIMIDSTFPQGDGYTARLDDRQFEWLAEDLRRTDPKKPVLILSHIPILAVCVFFDGDNEKSGDWVVPGAWVHIDSRRIKDLFLKHPNVKVCLSGHVHLIDRVEYLGVSYVCNGAVCGGWWEGPYQECDAGYALVDLYDDGSFENRYVQFGWKPVKA